MVGWLAEMKNSAVPRTLLSTDWALFLAVPQL